MAVGLRIWQHYEMPSIGKMPLTDAGEDDVRS